MLEGMNLIRARHHLLAAAGAAAVLMIIHSAPGQTLPPNTINVERWPQDVPCRVLKKYPDGTWEITVPYILYYTPHRSTKFKNVRVTAYWNRKCRGQTN